MKCPRCGTKMKIDSEVRVDDDYVIVVYYCPNCGETGSKLKKSKRKN